MNLTDLIPDLETLSNYHFQGSIPDLLLRLVAALIIFLIGRWVARLARKAVASALKNTNLSQSAVTAFDRITHYTVLGLTLILALTVLGVSVGALVGAVGIIILLLAFTMQESLRDLAATINFMTYQPFREGELIEAAGQIGFVEEIQLLNTVLRGFDNKMLSISNSRLQGDIIVNYSRKGTLRADLEFEISYSDDAQKAQELILEELKADDRVLPMPAPTAPLLVLGANGVTVGARAFVAADNYWNLQWDMRSLIRQRLEDEGMTIPFPQSDVHIYTANGTTAE